MLISEGSHNDKAKVLLKHNTLACALLFLLSLLPVLYLFGNNANKVKISAILQPVIIYFSIALFSYIIFLLLMKSIIKSALATSLITLILIHYRYIEFVIQKVLPNLYYWHIVPILVLLLLYAANMINKFVAEAVGINISICMTVALAALTTFNILLAIPKVLSANKNIVSEDANEIESVNNKGYPNIYLLVFDEYAGYLQLSNMFDFNNDEFMNCLQNNGFTFSKDSFNEYYFTNIALSNLLSMNYLVHDEMTDDEIEDLTKDPYLFEYLRKKGYSIRGVGHKTRYLPSITQSESVVRALDGKTFYDLALANSVLYPFINKDDNEHATIITDSFQFIEDATQIPESSMFTFFYLMTPHSPYFFDRDGEMSVPPEKRYTGDKSIYLAQLQYISDKIVEATSFLTQNDPDSIIIVMSDHGYRDWDIIANAEKRNDAFLNKNSEAAYVTNILNAVYYQGDKALDIDGKSGINTLRSVFNTLFNDDMSMLEATEYDKLKK